MNQKELDPNQWELTTLDRVPNNRPFWRKGKVFTMEEGHGAVPSSYVYVEKERMHLWRFGDGHLQFGPKDQVRLVPERPDFEIPHEVPMPPE